MSNYTSKNKPSNMDLSFIRSKIQESLDNGVDDDEDSIEQLVRYYASPSLKVVEVEYMQPCRLYSVKFTTVDNDKCEYQYRFFLKSYRKR